MENVKNQLIEQMQNFLENAAKKPSKAGHQRMRKATLTIAKLGKEFRRLSLEEDNK